MKHIRNFSFFILPFSFAFASLLANAAPSYWAAVETSAYTKDTSEGENIEKYAMYYCTIDTATKLFGGSSVKKIETYIKNNFATAKDKATTYDSVAFSDDEYHILDYVSAAFGNSDYVAFALYGEDAYRVYGEGSAALTPNGQLVFNASSAASGSVGNWQQVQVPEPTSALLVLLGVAGLTLKRTSSVRPCRARRGEGAARP